MAEAQVAVLIDYENVGLDPIEPLLDQMAEVGRIIIKRAYADWSVPREKQAKALELGIETVHHFRSPRSGKNSSDISLAIDAVDLLYRSPVDTFVIVSADTDFVPLVSKLRSAGKTVIGAGRRDVVSETLVRSCDRYIFLEDQAGPGQAQRPATPTGEVDSLLLRALAASMDVQGEVTGSKLHETMRRIDPSFDYKALGFRTFVQFLESSQDIEIARPSSHRGDVILRLRPTGSGNGAREASIGTAASPGAEASSWDLQVHQAWSARARAPGNSIPGSWAGGEAAKVLGVPKLSVSRYKTLQRLLDASDTLKAHWSRDKNVLIRR